MFISRNPATGEIRQTYPSLTPAQVEAALALAHNTFLTYRQVSLSQRAQWMIQAAQILDDECDALARLMTEEVGKTLQASQAEIQKFAAAFRFYAAHGPEFLADEPVASDAAQSFVRYQPLGPVLAVMPWNFPLWQVVRFAAPALMAGNVGLLKPAETVPAVSLALEDALHRAGFPAGAFQSVLVETDAIGGIIADPRVAAATLTGSEAAGRAVAEACGAALKPVVLELGGSDPFVVLPGADIAEAVRVGIAARTQNNGQSCIAAKRFVVHADVYDDFAGQFVAGMAALRVGDPMNAQTQVGPLHTARARETLHRQVRALADAGARILTGGCVLDRPGYFYAPTVIADIPADAPAAREELFGPVALLFRAADTDHAIALANETEFGLGASVWCNDAGLQERAINQLECGMVFVNGMVASDPRLPFGGIKHSGIGRELSAQGMKAFMNAKTVWIGPKSSA